MACILVKALSLASLLSVFPSLTHASPHALGAITRRAQAAAVSVVPAVPLTLVQRRDLAQHQLYIVAFEDGVAYNESFLQDVSAVTGVPTTLETDLTGIIFNGVSIQVGGDVDADIDIEAEIASLPGVLAVSRDEPIVLPFINVTSTTEWNQDVDNNSSSSSSMRLAAAAPETYLNDKVMMQVDQLRALGYTGKDIKVAVIDNAIDTNHPALTVDFYTDYRQPVDIADPNPECKSHATACGGLISSLPGPGGFNTGVAPGVKLGNYIIGGCTHGGTSGHVIQALEQAAKDKVNIISASLIYGINWKFLEATRVFTKVTEQGVLLVFGAGNSGNDGMFRTTETCSAPGVLCVGMLTNTVVSSWENRTSVIADGEDAGWELGWLQSKLLVGEGWPATALPVWANMASNAGGWNGHGGDGCQELPADTPDLSEYIVLIRRNLCNEDDMIDRVAAKGAKYILIAELYEGFVDVFNPDIRREHPTVNALGTISGLHGVDILKLLREGQRATLDMKESTLNLKERPRTENDKQIGLRMDSGSQWGPTFDAGTAVDIAAPGTDIPILAPVGSPGGKYGIATGTSLATPLVAGAAALVAEALGTTDPKIIANVLISTSKPLEREVGSNNGWGPGLASTAHQGGGLIQLVNAIGVTATLDIDSLEFNHTEHRQTRSFTITNRGSGAITFDMSNIPAASIYTFAADGVPSPVGGADRIRNEQYIEGAASLTFSSTTVSVPGNGQATVQVTATDPSGLDKTRLPVWSGYVALNGSDGTSLTLPYLGISGDMDRVPKVTQALVRNSGATLPAEEVIVEVHHGMGSRVFEMFLVDAETGEKAHEGAMFSPMTVATVAYTIGWRGEIQGTQIPAGEYRIRTRALRAFAQPGSATEDDYLYFDTEPFSFKR